MITHKLADVAKKVFRTKPLEAKKSSYIKGAFVLKLFKQEKRLSNGLYVMEIDKNALSFNSHSANESIDHSIDLYLRVSKQSLKPEIELAEI